jgi:3-oxoacyl-[acyl-carrier protein] reductase
VIAPLAGKRALVTGSSAGLGAGIAERLAADGAEVCLHGRDRDRLEAARVAVARAGGRIHAVTGSLSDDAGALAVAEQARAAMGGIDILVNNAGGESAGNGQAEWLDATPDEWMATYNSNVGSMVRLIRACVPAMKAAGWGRVINLSSVSVDTPLTVIPDYQASKTAIRSLTRSLALALANSGVTANSVSPGLTLSNGPEAWIRRIADDNGWGEDWETIKTRAEKELTTNFVGRIGMPADIAHAVAFLADPRADFVNAIDVCVDGGH